jgi:hypothetical protein
MNMSTEQIVVALAEMTSAELAVLAALLVSVDPLTAGVVSNALAEAMKK